MNGTTAHLIAILTVKLVVVTTCALAQQTPSRPPNIVFILIDDLGHADLGGYGSQFHQTPNLDAFARSGMRFTDAYAASPVCSPTRASILTGKTPARLGITDWIPGENRSEQLAAVPNRRQLALDELTLAEALLDAGYSTGFIGKWHLGGKAFHPEDQGFASNVAGNHWGHPHGGYFSPYGMENIEDGPEGEYLADRLGSEAVAFLKAHADEPFFLYLCPYVVHTPIQVKPETRRKYELALEELPEAERDPGFVRLRDAHTRQRQSHPAYAAMVEHMDTNVGRVLSAIDELGLDDDTIVIFTSDNGGLSTARNRGSCKTANTPLRAGKGWCYEGGIRVPLIVRWPGVTKAGSTCAAPVTSTDFYPSVLEMAALPLRSKQHLDGRSLVPLLRGAKSLDRDALFWHYPHYHGSGHRPSSAVRAGDWKLIHFHEDDSAELYNLKKDVAESRDLAAGQPKRAAELRALLDTWREGVGALMPRPNPVHPENLRAEPHEDFEIVSDCRIETVSSTEYEMTGGTHGLVLGTLDRPKGLRHVLELDLTSVGGPWQNGFVTFGNTDDPEELISAGLYIGGGQLAIFEGRDTGGATRKPFHAGEQGGKFHLRVEVALDGESVTLKAAGQSVTRSLSKPLTSIRCAGYTALRTTTRFQKITWSSGPR